MFNIDVEKILLYKEVKPRSIYNFLEQDLISQEINIFK